MFVEDWIEIGVKGYGIKKKKEDWTMDAKLKWIGSHKDAE